VIFRDRNEIGVFLRIDILKNFELRQIILILESLIVDIVDQG